jgi:O-antigen/teichoic acid export membrane protein
MKIFDFQELGVITLISTASLLLGMFQFGLLNGGYRIIALKNSNDNKKTNNFIFSYFLFLTIFLSFILLFIYFSGAYSDLKILLSILLLSIFTLTNNWLSNALIASSDYTELNFANVVSALLGLLSIVLPYNYGLNGALFCLLIQPLVFIITVFFRNTQLLPNAIDFDIAFLKLVLNFGFVPYLSGLFILIYQQIERWTIGYYLGPVFLGRMYLVFIVTTVWMLIPNAINNLFFPRTIKLFSNNSLVEFTRVIHEYKYITIIYSIVGSLAVMILLPKLVYYFFPAHYPYVHLVFIVLPGLIFRILSNPFNLYFNSCVEYDRILWSDVLSTIIYLVLILILKIFGYISLEFVLGAFSIYSFLRLSYLYFYYLISNSKYSK